jgi:hypothetical protein
MPLRVIMPAMLTKNRFARLKAAQIEQITGWHANRE